MDDANGISEKTPDGSGGKGPLYEREGLVYYSEREEVLNSASHLLGAVFGLAAMIALLVGARNAVGVLVAVSFGAGTTFPYLISAVYHGVRDMKAKKFWRKTDHACTCFIITANSVPLCLLTGTDALNIGLSAASYGLCFIGAILCFYNLRKFSRAALAINLATAAIGVAAYFSNRAAVPPESRMFYLAGSVLCLAGLAFYGRKKPYLHTVFHFLMLSGTFVYFGALATLFFRGPVF